MKEENISQAAAYGVLKTGDGLPPVSSRRMSSREPTSASAMTGMPSSTMQRNQDRTSRPTTLAQNGLGVDLASVTGAPDDDYYGLRNMDDDGFGEVGGGSSIDAFEARQASRVPVPAPVRRQVSGESVRSGGNAAAAAAAAEAARAYDDAWGSEVTVGDGFGDDDDDDNDRTFTWGETRVGPDADYSVGGAAAGMTHMSLQNTESLRAKQAHEEFVLQMQQQTLLQSQQMAAMMGMVPAPPSTINTYGNSASFNTSLPPRALPIAAENMSMPPPLSTVSPRLISTDAADAKFQEFARKLREKDKDIGENSTFAACGGGTGP